MFFSPETWRELIKPQIVKAVNKTHELGMIFELHSCGFIEQVVPEFVEMGIDSWQGQEINDIVKLKELTGGKLSFHTTPRYQDFQADSLAGVLKEEDVRERVRKGIMENAKGGNYMPMVLPWGDWWRPIMIEEIERYGKEVYR
jgi:uroporphyrinogen decarboxylase